jgi:Serine dehydrogenase proteinase
LPTWNKVLEEIATQSALLRSTSPLDTVRRSYLKDLSAHTGRNVIAYYSGWLQRPSRSPVLAIGDDDMNAFMMCVHSLDPAKGLDLLVHTPGGSIPAVEALVTYLRAKFGTNIRAFVPQLAMSAGTMMACSAREIWMGKQSSLGPIDPQLNNIPCRGVLAEFEQAVEEITLDRNRLAVWQAIIGQYHPTFVGECKRLVEWSEAMVAGWLASGMFVPTAPATQRKKDVATEKAKAVAKELCDHGAARNHSRHLSIDEVIKTGLTIKRLESDQTLQDLVLTVHHAFCHTFAQAPALKIVENHIGAALINTEQSRQQ